jgi:hypothetical protein
LRRRLSVIALFCNFVGSLFLIFTLSITPSSFRQVDNGHGQIAICVSGQTVMAGWGGGFVLSGDACPGWDNAKPTAQLAFQRNGFLWTGMALSVVGFLLQLISVSVPTPRSA